MITSIVIIGLSRACNNCNAQSHVRKTLLSSDDIVTTSLGRTCNNWNVCKWWGAIMAWWFPHGVWTIGWRSISHDRCPVKVEETIDGQLGPMTWLTCWICSLVLKESDTLIIL